MTITTRFSLNGRATTVEGEEAATLLWALRHSLALTGTKYGCGAGVCGVCTVLADGRAIRSCVTPLRSVEGNSVLTVEGLAVAGRLDPLQEAFIEHGAFQCGFCTPGMLLAAHALLHANRRPTRQEIAEHMDHQLCRCGAHQRIVDAVEHASARLAPRS